MAMTPIWRGIDFIMCDPLEAQSHIDDFFNLVDKEDVNEYRNVNYRIKLLESPATGNTEPTLRWRNVGSRLSSHCIPTIEVRELHKRPACAIRIMYEFVQSKNEMLLKHDEQFYKYRRAQPNEFAWASRHFRRLFLSNCLPEGKSSRYSWLHFLCKNIVVRDTSDSLFDVHHPTSGDQHPSWVQGGFFMKWNKNGGNITLICFGSFPKLEERLKRFIENTDNVQTALYDPYTLYAIILDELHLKMDSIQIFEFASAQQKRSSREYDVDFVRLHHLMKLVIHLKEACEAIIETAKSMQTAHNDLFDKEHFRNQKPHPSIPATNKDLEYLLSSFHGLGLRIRSVETRASNVINLAFNLVIQRDSTLLQEDSQSMKTVAIMTLVFLPGTAVAASSPPNPFSSCLPQLTSPRVFSAANSSTQISPTQEEGI
ncbi:uncharacterized protein PAC_12851 [Phialocephala subalpina]|uniref:Uncharacterized protein n=1 Tax=Phialocephala subalpina TaxID=576137 RepID=A0A1L7XD53_9HELO|nr:uncharacterized protein PAC_12851 [Phialocephala subalpina]